MVRRIVEIDQKKCSGCGLCASACHEGAIGMVDGKATLLKDDYCDGLGDCLPACPTGAISFVEREAAAYDEAAVQVHMAARKAKQVLEANAAANASARSAAKPATQLLPMHPQQPHPQAVLAVLLPLSHMTIFLNPLLVTIQKTSQ